MAAALALIVGGGASPVFALDQVWARGVFPIRDFHGFTSHYGPRRLNGVPGMHRGIDIAAPSGATVQSWWSGVVVDVIDDGLCGIGLVIRSGAYQHIYCHLQGQTASGVYRFAGGAVRRGQRLRRGQWIGRVGLTGRTTGPHLHWGIRHNGQWLDPARILRAMARGRRQGHARVQPLG
ncbi:M23 family metallopeptidase [Synechococcus sp. RSCCF101]|uniref:M23 family metallopeptidase n=1 Tax=Synechococcus sp. RSCCF101 TaxID=2511069 RepID=UPI001CD9FBEB|nr:M23 family metallopeptidase [Synechococcus sp. RSCCF101]